MFHLSRIVSSLLLIPLLSTHAIAAPITEIRVGFIPAENAKESIKNTEPFVRYLRDKLGVKVRPIISTDYSGAVEALRHQQVDIALIGAQAYVFAEREAKAHLLLKSVKSGNAYYRSIIFTRDDSPIRTLKDLKGQKFAFVDPGSASGYLFPNWLLKREGFNSDRDFSRRFFAGSHNGVILAVKNGQADAGATWSNDEAGKDSALSLMAKTPTELKQFRVITATPPIPGEALVARSQLPEVWRLKIKQALLDLKGNKPQQKRIFSPLSFDYLDTATPSDYDVVKKVYSLSR